MKTAVEVKTVCLTFPVSWAPAVVVVGSIHTCSSVSTRMGHTVIPVLFTVVSCETWKREERYIGRIFKKIRFVRGTNNKSKITEKNDALH